MIRFSSLSPNKRPPQICFWISAPVSSPKLISTPPSLSMIAHNHYFKEKQPCQAGLEWLKVVHRAISKSQDNDPFEGITKSDVDAAPESFVIDASDTEAIDVEQTSDFQNSLSFSEYLLYICYFYSFC